MYTNLTLLCLSIFLVMKLNSYLDKAEGKKRGVEQREKARPASPKQHSEHRASGGQQCSEDAGASTEPFRGRAGAGHVGTGTGGPGDAPSGALLGRQQQGFLGRHWGWEPLWRTARAPHNQSPRLSLLPHAGSALRAPQNRSSLEVMGSGPSLRRPTFLPLLPRTT